MNEYIQIIHQSICNTYCLLYRFSTGCSNCECAPDGTVNCTRINTCTTNPITGEVTMCRPCDPLAPPYSCDVCADGYYRDGKGGCTEIPTCGGIDFCTRYAS